MSKPTESSLSHFLMELPPGPDIKLSKNKSEPQALWLVDGIDISNLSMLLERGLPRLSRELPPKPDIKQNKKKPEPQAPGLAVKVGISSMGILLELSLPRFSIELPPKSKDAKKIDLRIIKHYNSCWQNLF